MLEELHPLLQLVKEDRRYSLEAYIFLFEAMQYAQDVLGMGAEKPTEPLPGEKEPPALQKHVSGRELCEAIRLYALEQFGYMAKTVLNKWGIHTTGDFGEMVFNLIRIGQMRKTPSDTQVDFENIYDFDVAFQQEFKLSPPE